MNDRKPASRPLHDRAFLLQGPQRNEILTLDEVRQYGTDSFSDADYLRRCEGLRGLVRREDLDLPLGTVERHRGPPTSALLYLTAPPIGGGKQALPMLDKAMSALLAKSDIRVGRRHRCMGQ
jgi:hypothetical protein